LAPEYQSAWDQFVFLNPEKSGFSFRREFLQKMEEKELADAITRERETLIKQLGERFRGFTLERLREVAEKRRIHGLTASEWRVERAANAPPAPKVRQYSDYPTLPEFLVLPGEIKATRIDAAFLLGLARTDYWLYKKFVSKYGGNQITDRQNAATAAQE